MKKVLLLFSLLAALSNAHAYFINVDKDANAAIEASIDEVLKNKDNQQSAIALQSPWLNEGELLTPAAFERALYWIASDVQGRKLIADAMKRGRVTKAADLIKYVVVGNLESSVWMIEGGKTRSGSTGYSSTIFPVKPKINDIAQVLPKIADSSDVALSVEERDQLYLPLIENVKHRFFKPEDLRDFFFLHASPDYAMVMAMEIPSLALQLKADLRKAVLTLAHELVHFTYMNFADRFSAIADAPTKEEAAYAFVLSAGDEVDAYAMEKGLKARIYGGKHVIEEEIRDLFDDQGELVGDRRRFAEYVLDGIGYRKKFEKEYIKDLYEAYKDEFEFEQDLEDLLQTRALQQQQFERKIFLYRGINRELDQEEKDILEKLEKSSERCALARKRIEKTIAQYKERIKSYEDKLGDHLQKQ